MLYLRLFVNQNISNDSEEIHACYKAYRNRYSLGHLLCIAAEIPSNKYPSEYIIFEISENVYASAVTKDDIFKTMYNFEDSAPGWFATV